MGTSSNLSELTVTCSQCGSANMERLGQREYRCNHCGAITVVSQDQQTQYDQANGRQAPTDNGPVLSPSQEAAAVATGTAVRKGFGIFRILLLAGVLIAVGIGVVNSMTGGSSSSSGGTASAPSVDGKQLTLSPPEWISDPSSGVSSGRYVQMLTNHSTSPIQVPRYSMTLFVDGVKGATAASQAPLARLLPGEHEPVAFAFETPSGNVRTETAVPDTVERADGSNATLLLKNQQLVRETGKPEYRLVALAKNDSQTAVKAAQVLVMLYGANHQLIGYGSNFERALRPGEQAALDIHIPTSNVNPVQSYEYLVDATAEEN
jgi:DNA-directed RNA polymerase subunit RPC12/RpoP